MRIAVIGTGYVGLVAGACFADSGNDVTCVDVDAGKVARLRAGEVPLYEPGLAELVARNVRERRLGFTTEVAEAAAGARAVFITVGTPEGDHGEADLRFVLGAAEDVGRALRQYAVVVVKSTVPVGTTQRVRQVLARVARADFDVAANPEFLKEGAAVEDFTRPDRVVIGTESERARALLAELYAPFVRTGRPLLFMDPESAELTKYAANAMLATRISFMNDVAALCEKLGADVEHVRQGLGADRRIGPACLFPGLGYGGSCFPKDVKALEALGRAVGLELELLHAVERTNARQKRLLLEKAVRHYGEDLTGRVFGVWGLAFKPKTDDLREAPSLPLIDGLLSRGARVQAHDPVAHASARRVLGERITYAPTPYAAAEGADALFLVTEWNEFRSPDFERLRTLMRAPVLFDGRNLFEPARMRERGFTYFCLGRGGWHGKRA